jgi:hypothetical protein
VNPDLTADAGPLEPGLSELFGMLTSPGDGSELAGEQEALTMFGQNARAAGAPAPGRSRLAAGSRRTAARGRWGIRVAAAATIALSGGFAGAAYASALPAPVQHIAYKVLGFAGVPDSHNGHGSSSSHQPTGPAGGHQNYPAAAGGKSPSARAGSASAKPGAGAAPKPSSAAAAGPDRLSASAARSQITAGSSLVISGVLENPAGAAIPGASVTLLERPALERTWRVVRQAETNASGNVAVTLPVLGVNAALMLTGPGGSSSPVVAVTVVPPVDTQLVLGAKDLHDGLIVSTQYAHQGNIVVLEKEAADGSWVAVRQKRLNVNGQAEFLLNGRSLQDEMIRVVLLATPRHAQSISYPVTVPAPVA